ncbi:purine-cytosine permease family protein [Glaciibacter sp. 2TAF33]|uniref:purine-cytosine permease family protein n=1 Tax=Glaciibacter sp. 2TAF33 TaxID=3233015 RepID=UPI003F934F49
MTTTTREETGLLGRVETRSIDYVPLRERKGRMFDQSTVWFAGSAQLLTIATGAIGIALGLNLAWTLIGLALGTILGTIPVSAHATQGPHLGLPQMVQSRPQFGRFGALFIWAMAIAVYWGYVVLGGNLIGVTAEGMGWGGAAPWAIIVCLVALVLAIFGYHWLHAAQRYISYGLIVVILVYVIGLGALGQVPGEFFNLAGTFQVGPFLAVVTAAAAYQLTWAFFVSDYSRYMPANTKRSTIVATTSGGLFLGLFSFMAIGAVAASLMPLLLERTPGLSERLEGDATGFAVSLVETGKLVFPGLGELVLIFGGLGLIGLMAMCVYGGSLTLITALDSIRPVRPTRRIRVITILIVGLTGAVAAALVPTDFLYNNLYTVLIVLAYLMGPWTAVNLTDFFFVRRGHYSVTEMFRRDGMYGLWSWRGIVSYVAAVIAMLPFMSIPGVFEGSIFTALGGVDLAFFIGIPVGGVIYWLLCRNLDLVKERATIAEADQDIDAIGKPID